MAKGKLRNFQIGSFNENAYRKRPTPEKVNNFLRDMGPELTDYDVYLWGSWPEKKNTWDVDFLLNNDSKGINTEELENVFLKGLNSSLVDNSFLADVGYTNKPVESFNDIYNNYNKTGKKFLNSGYMYGNKWYADNKLFKDRSRFKGGMIQELDHNVLRTVGAIPYNKMLNAGQDGFDKYYKNKPMLLKERKKIYG